MSYKHRYYNKGSFEVELMLYEADDDGIIDREGPDRVTLSIPAEWVYEGETFDKEGQLREALAWAIDNEYPTKIYKIIETRSPKDEVILKGWQEFDEDVFEKGGQLAMAKAMRGVAQRGESKISAERQQIKQMRGFQAEARKTIDNYKKGIKDTEKSIKTYDKAIRDNKKDMLETYNEVEKAKKEAVKYDEGGKVYTPEEMAELLKRKGWRFSDNTGVYEIATNLGYKWNGRHWVDENDNPYYAKGGYIFATEVNEDDLETIYVGGRYYDGKEFYDDEETTDLKEVIREWRDKFLYENYMEDEDGNLITDRLVDEYDIYLIYKNGDKKIIDSNTAHTFADNSGFAKGGSVKEPESEDEPKVVRYYFEDEEFEYAKGGMIEVVEYPSGSILEVSMEELKKLQDKKLVFIDDDYTYDTDAEKSKYVGQYGYREDDADDIEEILGRDIYAKGGKVKVQHYGNTLHDFDVKNKNEAEERINRLLNRYNKKRNTTSNYAIYYEDENGKITPWQKFARAKGGMTEKQRKEWEKFLAPTHNKAEFMKKNFPEKKKGKKKDFAKGGKLNSLGIEDESVSDHIYKADQHLRSVGSKLWRNKHPKVLKYKKAKDNFDESFDDLFTGRELEELGYAKGGMTFNLEPSDRKSFYGKAKIITKGGINYLQSYSTIVAEYNPTTKEMKIYDYYSPTTARHINAFLDYYGYPSMSKSEIMANKNKSFAKGGKLYDIMEYPTGNDFTVDEEDFKKLKSKKLIYRDDETGWASNEDDYEEISELIGHEYAKGGKVEKKQNNEMLIGGIAGILLGIFLNR